MARTPIGSCWRVIGGLGPKPPENTGTFGDVLRAAAPTQKNPGLAAAEAGASSAAHAASAAAARSPLISKTRIPRRVMRQTASALDA